MNEPGTIQNVTAVIAWRATSTRTNQLTLQVDAPGTSPDATKTGASPLNLTSPPFPATKGERVRFRIALVGSETADQLLAPQEIQFGFALVVRRDGNLTTAFDGLWEGPGKCPT